MTILMASAVGMLALALSACAASRDRAQPSGAMGAIFSPIIEAQQDIRLMSAYDADHDGTVSRQELEAGLARQFADCDSDRDGRLNNEEIQAENGRRWRANSNGYSPLIDWNLDGVVSMAEFATTARSVFGELDKDQDGRLSAVELRPPRPLRPVPYGQVRRP